MAGTTVDEDNVVYKTLQKLINNEGYHFSLEQVLAVGAGQEKLAAIKGILALDNINVDEVVANKIYKNFMIELAQAYERFQLKPQPGAEELFIALKEKNVFVVLNTGYDILTATTILEKLNWKIGQQIDGLITATDVQNSRPHPDMILLAMNKFCLKYPSEVVKVGDSIIDIEEGKNAGCALSIGITTGAHTYDQLLTAQPDYIINHISELLNLI